MICSNAVDSRRPVAYISWYATEGNRSPLPRILSRSWATNIRNMVRFLLNLGMSEMLSHFVVWLTIWNAEYGSFDGAASVVTARVVAMFWVRVMLTMLRLLKVCWRFLTLFCLWSSSS